MILQRKRKTKDPCPECGLHRDLCICSLVPILSLKTRVSLIIHHRELKRTTNTGKLAIKSLTNSEMRVRGEKNVGALDLSDLITPEYRSVFFFSGPEAIELDKEFVAQSPLPILLIVPDGNWRQASKVYSRQPELKNIPMVKISSPNLAKFHLRAEHSPEGMATLQAIACALGIIEGEAVKESLLALYEAKLQATLRGRGTKFS